MASADGAQTLNWTVLESMSVAPRSRIHGLGSLGFMISESLVCVKVLDGGAS